MVSELEEYFKIGWNILWQKLHYMRCPKFAGVVLENLILT